MKVTYNRYLNTRLMKIGTCPCTLYLVCVFPFFPKGNALLKTGRTQRVVIKHLRLLKPLCSNIVISAVVCYQGPWLVSGLLLDFFLHRNQG